MFQWLACVAAWFRFACRDLAHRQHSWILYYIVQTKATMPRDVKGLGKRTWLTEGKGLGCPQKTRYFGYSKLVNTNAGFGSGEVRASGATSTKIAQGGVNGSEGLKSILARLTEARNMLGETGLSLTSISC